MTDADKGLCGTCGTYADTSGFATAGCLLLLDTRTNELPALVLYVCPLS